MLDILHEDAHILVVNKPAGMLTQGRPGGEISLESVIGSYLDRDNTRRSYLGTVHRLDRPVSGVILWAKTPKAARRLADGFARREVTKVYEAIVAGETPHEATGVWDDWLLEPQRGCEQTRIVPAGTPNARRGVTRYERIGTTRNHHRLQLQPETGRTHQLRVQSAARGWTIWGDILYGSSHAFPGGIALHARRLTIRHPTRDVPMTFEADYPQSWGEFLRDEK